MLTVPVPDLEGVHLPGVQFDGVTLGLVSPLALLPPLLHVTAVVVDDSLPVHLEGHSLVDVQEEDVVVGQGDGQ